MVQDNYTKGLAASQFLIHGHIVNICEQTVCFSLPVSAAVENIVRCNGVDSMIELGRKG
jgi:hypothetical protein